MSNSPKNNVHRVTYAIHVSTPEQCKQRIVDWLKRQSILYSHQAEKAQLSKAILFAQIRSDAYEEAANFIAAMQINPMPTAYVEYHDKSVDDWLMEGRFIEAIRKRRYNTGEGLKEAKLYCETRRDELGLTKK